MSLIKKCEWNWSRNKIQCCVKLTMLTTLWWLVTQHQVSLILHTYAQAILIFDITPLPHLQWFLKNKKKLKVSAFVYHHLQWNPDRQRFTFEVAYWPVMTLGGVAQLTPAIARTTDCNRGIPNPGIPVHFYSASAQILKMRYRNKF